MKNKHYILTIILLVKLQLCFSQIDTYYYVWNENTDIIRDQNIIERTITEYKNGNPIGRQTNKVFYDTLGRIFLELDYYPSDSTIRNTTNYFYDKLGNQTKCILESDDSIEKEVITYRYENNLLVEYKEITINIYNEITDSTSSRIVYDDKNRMKFEIDNMNDTITIFKYMKDSITKMSHPKIGYYLIYKNNKLISEHFSNPLLFGEGTDNFIYDEKDNLVVSKRLNKKGELIRKTEFIYDNGLITHSKRINNEGRVEKREEFIYKSK